MVRLTPLPLVVLATVASMAAAGIFYKGCEAPADHPTIRDGNFFNLCIQNHEFEDEAWAWTLTNTTISDTYFERCTFENNREKTSNFTETTFNNVTFHQCEFRSDTNEPLLFNKMGMRNVEFTDCRFDKSAHLLFEQFQFTNVTFTNCKFQGDTLFKLGELNEVIFDGCTFKHSYSVTRLRSKDSIRFHQTTIREMSFIDSEFVTPLRFEGSDIALMEFNDTKINQFWCHPERSANEKSEFSEKGLKKSVFSRFNDTKFTDVIFADKIRCNGATWNGMYMTNVMFLNDADFSGSMIHGMHWGKVKMEDRDKSCGVLDFSNTRFSHHALVNTSIACEANFENANVESVYIENLVAKRLNFKNAVFIDREYINFECCASVCASLQCQCVISKPSGACPVGGTNAGRTPVNTVPARVTSK